MATRLYKGVGVGTFLHSHDVARNGIPPRKPGGSRALADFLTHIRTGTAASSCISLTASYGVAYSYAKGFGTSFPTPGNPAHIYVIDIPDRLPPGMSIVDPMVEIVRSSRRGSAAAPYHHDGDQSFLLGVVDPAAFPNYLSAPARQPGLGATPRPANLSPELEAMARVLRDSELLVIRHIPPPALPIATT
jgi:hypothetical protein